VGHCGQLQWCQYGGRARRQWPVWEPAHWARHLFASGRSPRGNRNGLVQNTSLSKTSTESQPQHQLAPLRLRSGQPLRLLRPGSRCTSSSAAAEAPGRNRVLRQRTDGVAVWNGGLPPAGAGRRRGGSESKRACIGRIVAADGGCHPRPSAAGYPRESWEWEERFPKQSCTYQ